MIFLWVILVMWILMTTIFSKLLAFLFLSFSYFVSLFGTSRLSLTEWLSLGVLASMPLIVHELLVFSEALQNKAPKGARTLQETQKGQQHENGTPQPGEAV